MLERLFLLAHTAHQHIPIYLSDRPVSYILWYSRNEKDEPKECPFIPRISAAIFSSCEWNPPCSPADLHYISNAGLAAGCAMRWESINVLYRLTLDYQCRMHTQVYMVGKEKKSAGGRPSQKIQLVQHKKVLQKRFCLYFDASEKAQKAPKEIGIKTFGRLWLDFPHRESKDSKVTLLG